jgi:hypothetical protein
MQDSGNNLLDVTVEDDIEDDVDVMWLAKTFIMGPL